MNVHGVRVALLSYVDRLNPTHPGYPPARINVPDDRRRILAAARAARRAGADGVIVNLHTTDGDYVTRTSRRHRRLVSRLLAHRAITAVIGEGPHVAQRIRWPHGKPAVFSEGNLLASHHPPTACCGANPPPESGFVTRLHMLVRGGRARVTSLSYMPTFVRPRGMRVIPVGAGLRRGLASRRRLRSAYRRTVRLAGRSRRVHPIPRRLDGGA